MITKPWAFIVWGPPVPKGSMKCVGQRGRVKHVLLESDTIGSPKWRHKVAGQAARFIGEQADKYQAIQLELTYSIARPAGHYGTGRNSNQLRADAPKYPTARSGGDIDKLERNILDALQEAKVLVDDAQVIEVVHHKRYVVPERDRALYGDALEAPGVLVRLEPMTEAPLIELPYEAPTPCPHISNGVFCRYYEHGPESPHSYGGGLSDVIEARHCARTSEHEPHAWPSSDPKYTCSGAALPPIPDPIKDRRKAEKYAEQHMTAGERAEYLQYWLTGPGATERPYEQALDDTETHN